MSRTTVKAIRIPHPLWEAVELLRAPGRPLANYPSTNAAIVGMIVYLIAFPLPRELTARLAHFPTSQQDVVHDFLLATVRGKIDLRNALPKPATAEDLLELARQWQSTATQ